MRLPNAASLPPGELREIYLHWTAGTYEDVFETYHFCIADRDGRRSTVFATHDLRANMRDVRAGGTYAAHTQGRNSFSVGIAICAMDGATPHDFGIAPLREDQIEVACALAAQLRNTYAIALTAVRTHAEAALEDGYFGCGEDERWDIARLIPGASKLLPSEASATGDALRERVQKAGSAGA